MAKKTTTVSPKFNTNIHAIFQTNEDMEETGAWVEVNALYGLEIKIRRMRSDAASKAYEKLVAEQMGEGKLRKPNDISAEQTQSLLRKHLAANIVVDWKNLRDAETGDEIEYSVEVAESLMEVKDFRDFVLQAASERDTFRDKSDKDAEGN